MRVKRLVPTSNRNHRIRHRDVQHGVAARLTDW
jgi:hypothetical protein